MALRYLLDYQKGETMKKRFTSGLVVLSFACMPLGLSAESLLERVVTDVVLGVYNQPHYYDKRPYYYYNNRYYYGGEWRNGAYFYEGRRLDGGRFYERGYYDHHRNEYEKRYKKPKHPNHKNGYYKHNKHYTGEEKGHHKKPKKVKAHKKYKE